MNVSVGSRWEEFVDGVVSSGRYSSASEVVREGLRLVEEREAKLNELRTRLNAAIEGGGDNSIEDAFAAVTASLDDWERTKRARV